MGDDHLKRLELEFQFTKEKLVRAQEGERASSLPMQKKTTIKPWMIQPNRSKRSQEQAVCNTI
ncbi:hypothetical protein J1N35_035381 [Gossypium stocksii]|uniref:Uncharacterized protein n=1 Tax=Gossypium stocksii TaxID=47602 RepID=A0A9D3UTT5_9ROSI|nr:hypothetical protein J1N35_035381 [Gossypium stocksii]